MSTFKKGDRVTIAPGSRYYNRPFSNPPTVMGVIMSKHSRYELLCKVDWANGKSNRYSYSDLIKV